MTDRVPWYVIAYRLVWQFGCLPFRLTWFLACDIVELAREAGRSRKKKRRS